MTIVQLNPPIHFWIPEREDFGLAHLVIFQGVEEYLYFVCVMQKTGEVWTFDNRKVRGDVNYTLERVYDKNGIRADGPYSKADMIKQLREAASKMDRPPA